MDKVIILEVLDYRRKVEARHKLNVFPITIGRAYDCDVIVNDEYVSPHHVRIKADEKEITAVDLNSTNGLYEVKPLRKKMSTPVTSGLELKIGQTFLRFRAPDFQVEKARADIGGFLGLLNSPWLGLLFCMLAWPLIFFIDYLPMYDSNSVVASFNDNVLPLFLVALVWSFIVAISTKAHSQNFHFSAYFTLTTFAILLFTITELLYDLCKFSFSENYYTSYILAALECIVLTVILAIQIRIASSWSQSTAIGYAVALSVALTGLALLTEWAEKDDFNNEPKFSSALFPLGFQYVNSIPVAEMNTDLQLLKQSIDLEVESAPDNQQAEDY